MNDNTWTWMGGSDTRNELGVYGEKGNASTDNYPGARSQTIAYYDSLRKELWLFGGSGYSASDFGA